MKSSRQSGAGIIGSDPLFMKFCMDCAVE